ncbi:MAG TPA: IS1595 family transposase [Lacunisphaera sp.]|nr:IS1595 family transposase [Lacunisphaera sp.]
MTTKDLPSTQLEAVRFFGDAERCHEFLANMRWPEGIRCAHCQSEKVGKLVVTVVPSRSKNPDAKPTTRRLWNCKACKSQFTVKTGTIFEDSALGLDKWLPAVWMICNAKNGVSSCELARTLGVTQKSAWFMGHRIRLAMREGGFELRGTVEADETYYGPKAHRMNKEARNRRVIRSGGEGKIAVQGMLERSDKPQQSKVAVEVLEATNTPAMQKHVRNRVKKGSAIYTDAHGAYTTLKDEYDHSYVDHAVAYAKGAVHTNGLENFWSLLKRTLRGTYVHVSPMHLFRYLDEQATRFNERADDDQSRFLSSMQRVSGRRLPYVALTNIGLI